MTNHVLTRFRDGIVRQCSDSVLHELHTVYTPSSELVVPGATYVLYHDTYVRTYNVMSQLSDWKRAHMCTENHVCFGRIHGSQLGKGANAGQHTPTLSLPPSHHCLDGEVYRWNRLYNVWRACSPGHVGLDTNQSHVTRACITTLSATSWGDGPLKYPWVRESAAGRDPWDPRTYTCTTYARTFLSHNVVHVPTGVPLDNYTRYCSSYHTGTYVLTTGIMFYVTTF
jgi:hypothetical protein